MIQNRYELAQKANYYSTLADLRADSWKIFKIMAEFVEGYNLLAKTTNEITIFGSARTDPHDKYYQEAVRLGELLANHNFSVVTGGGPGIMEAANKGAFQKEGDSIGLGIELPMEQSINKYCNQALNFSYFFTRKVMLTSPSQAFVFFPGGYGTMDEFFQVINETNLGFAQRVPLVCVGVEFWTPLMEFLHAQPKERLGSLSESHFENVYVVDTAEEAFELVKNTKDVPNLGPMSAQNFCDSSGVNWRIFRIMAEFVEGVDFLPQSSQNLTILGTNKINQNSSYYQSAYQIASQTSQRGYSIITGGSTGIAEAANKAAFDNEKKTYGIVLKTSERPLVNEYISKSVSFDFPFTRQFVLTSNQNSFIFMPGGFGTLHQLFEVLTLMQTRKISKVPIILYDASFWKPLVTYIKDIFHQQYHTISPEDVDLFTITSHEDEVLSLLNVSNK
jgi:uncharacterized protein (TIGR00730 family)